MTRTDLLTLITVMDLTDSGHRPPHPQAKDYDELQASFLRCVATAARRAEVTLAAIEAELEGVQG